MNSNRSQQDAPHSSRVHNDEMPTYQHDSYPPGMCPYQRAQQAEGHYQPPTWSPWHRRREQTLAQPP